MKGCLIFFGAVFFVFLLGFCLIKQEENNRARIASWATEHGYTLAGPIEHPAWLESSPFWVGEDDAVYKVVLADRDHQKRTSWFHFYFRGMAQAWRD